MHTNQSSGGGDLKNKKWADSITAHLETLSAMAPWADGCYFEPSSLRWICWHWPPTADAVDAATRLDKGKKNASIPKQPCLQGHASQATNCNPKIEVWTIPGAGYQSYGAIFSSLHSNSESPSNWRSRDLFWDVSFLFCSSFWKTSHFFCVPFTNSIEFLPFFSFGNQSFSFGTGVVDSMRLSLNQIHPRNLPTHSTVCWYVFHKQTMDIHNQIQYMDRWKIDLGKLS